jgi:arginine decarboxylase
MEQMNQPHLDPSRVPIYEALRIHAQKKTASFHIPGHKSGQGIALEAQEIFEQMLSIDLTEITGLDDLYQPTGIIDEAQQLAAQCFGATHSFFLVNGSTVGNLVMILSVCEPGDVIIVQRNVHKSMIHGLMLAQVKAVFLTPAWDAVDGISHELTAQDVEQALAIYPQAKGVVLNNPDYYGRSMDLRAIADVVHLAGKPLLVDEAHGGHFGFHPALPLSALSAGADMVVQSTHKMLSSMTMGAILHLKGHRIPTNRVKQRLSMLQTSSPSYPILASIDLARKQMHQNGFKLIEHALSDIHDFRQKLKHTYPWYGQNVYEYTRALSIHQDPFKLMIEDRTRTLSGHMLKHQLEQRDCFVELSHDRGVLLVFSFATSQEDVKRLYNALEQISQQFELQKQEIARPESNINYLHLSFSLSEPVQMDMKSMLSDLDKETIWEIPISDVQQAIGFCSADTLIPYPPGIPLCFRGEKITTWTASQLQRLASSQVHIQGTVCYPLTFIRVYRFV